MPLLFPPLASGSNLIRAAKSGFADRTAEMRSSSVLGRSDLESLAIRCSFSPHSKSVKALYEGRRPKAGLESLAIRCSFSPPLKVG